MAADQPLAHEVTTPEKNQSDAEPREENLEGGCDDGPDQAPTASTILFGTSTGRPQVTPKAGLSPSVP